MEANELRIGNWILLEKDGIKKEYQMDSGFDIYKADESNCADISPILLTEEWIKKFGFYPATRMNSGWEREFGGSGPVKEAIISIHLSNDNIKKNNPAMCEYKEVRLWDAHVKTNYTHNYFKCEYVHQLQNLMYALSGEELTYKNK